MCEVPKELALLWDLRWIRREINYPHQSFLFFILLCNNAFLFFHLASSPGSKRLLPFLSASPVAFRKARLKVSIFLLNAGCRFTYFSSKPLIAALMIFN